MQLPKAFFDHKLRVVIPMEGGDYSAAIEDLMTIDTEKLDEEMAKHPATASMLGGTFEHYKARIQTLDTHRKMRQAEIYKSLRGTVNARTGKPFTEGDIDAEVLTDEGYRGILNAINTLNEAYGILAGPVLYALNKRAEFLLELSARERREKSRERNVQGREARGNASSHDDTDDLGDRLLGRS